MGPGNGLQPPSSGAGASQKIRSTKKACCRCDDYTKEIFVDASGRYFKHGLSTGFQSYGVQMAKYQILVPLKSGTKITAKSRFRLERLPAVTDEQVEKAKRRLAAAIDWLWNGRLALIIDDPECGKMTFPIEYAHEWVTFREHHIVRIFSQYKKEHVLENRMEVDVDTGEWTYAHELGHCYGLPDEYFRDYAQSTSYYNPDGTKEAPLPNLHPPKPRLGLSEGVSLMAWGVGLLPHHGWNIAIEVRDLLAEKLGRKVRCTVQTVQKELGLT